MTNTIRMEMIDRFRSGLMSQAEQTRFNELLASDVHLRKLLEADDLISGAIHSELAGIATDHAVTQARVMESLANVSGMPGRGIPAQSLSQGGRLPLSGASGFMKAVVTTVMLGGLAAGVYGLWPQKSATTPTVPSAPAVVQPELQHPQVAAPEPAATPATTLPDTTSVTAPAVSDRPASRAVPHTQPEKKSTIVKEAAPAVVSTQPESSETPQQATKPERKPVQVRKIDSVKLKIDVKK
jgi:hypothetical protein